jgi:hypothetical protein
MDRHEPKASELLGDWRAAERDVAAAKTAQSIAELALESATAAEEAAVETEKAAQMAVEAARSAQAAAVNAKKAAAHAAEAALLLTAGAEGDRARAKQAVETAETAETDARTRYDEASKKGFPKGST